MWIYIISAIILLIIVYAVILYNSFVKLNNKVNEAFSTMDIYLKKRWDLVVNILETIQGYSKDEKYTFTEVTKLRNISYDNMTNEEKVTQNIQLSNNLNTIMTLSENYPDLKANENFKNLNLELIKIEEDIANSRKYYNGTVKLYNNKVQMFPNNIFANIFGYSPKTMFEAMTNERENIAIDL